MTIIYRPDRTQLGFSEETVFAGVPTAGAQTLWMGILQDTINLPDPDIDWKRYYAHGAGRDVHIQAPGKSECNGSIPVILQNGRILKYPFGAVSTTTISTGASAHFRHVITGAPRLPSICLEATYLGTPDFVRYFRGTKVGALTLSAEEEGELRASLDLITSIPERTGNARSTVTPLTTAPYMFHQGALSFWGTSYARIQNFEVSLDNQLKPKWYFQSAAGRYAFEINEGRRVYEMKATVVIHDTRIFDELKTPLVGGFTANMKLTRQAFVAGVQPEDSIEIIATGCQLKSAPHPIPDTEDIPIELTILPRVVQVVVCDQIAAY